VFSVVVDGSSLQRLIFTGPLLAELDLNELPAQALCMLMLEPGAGVRRLSDRLALSKGTVSAVLRDLRRRGLVAEEVDPDDRRRRRQYLTGAGEQLAWRLARAAKPVIDHHRGLVVAKRPA
jgi:DNA-binding MarR family transcriptional regulator